MVSVWKAFFWGSREVVQHNSIVVEQQRYEKECDKKTGFLNQSISLWSRWGKKANRIAADIWGLLGSTWPIN